MQVLKYIVSITVIGAVSITATGTIMIVIINPGTINSRVTAHCG